MRRFVPLTSVLLLVGALGGCNEAVNIACPSWAISEDPQEHYDAAPLVIVVSHAERDGETAIFGVQAHAYQASVEEVLKGDVGDSVIRISSMPDPCTEEGVVYPDGDPLEAIDRVIFFASDQEGEWFTLTPFGGVVSFPEGTEHSFDLEPKSS